MDKQTDADDSWPIRTEAAGIRGQTPNSVTEGQGIHN